MTALGPDRQPNTPLTLPALGEYLFGATVEPVTVLALTMSGEPVIVRHDGSMAVVSLHRVRLTRRDLS